MGQHTQQLQRCIAGVDDAVGVSLRAVVAHTGGNRILGIIVDALSAAGQDIDDLAVAGMGMQTNGRAHRQRQAHHRAHTGIVKFTDDGLALAALEMGHGVGGDGVEIKDHGRFSFSSKSPSASCCGWDGAACGEPWPRSGGYAHG